ncbi:uncharacterized protein LOC124487464 isoform X2 [Hypomesus transpacificus]|uniref:uncharacterized protein LOC124487464 isoform X2 n=1 Tax=Hypomesus transpacificus TaxID=137520 RepID=UPI001F085C75|nr:uncharacterized protein LOC124487464 isoform X2 [Hypomesus transpacificus]
MRELVCELENILSEMQAYERRLSELFDGKITVEGLDTFLQKIRSAATQDVRKCLSPALKGLPIMATGSMKSTSTSSSGQTEPEFVYLTMPDFTMGAEVLVPGMMTCSLKHLREKPGEMVQRSLAKLTIQLSNLGLVSVVGKKAVAATCEICDLVMRVVSIFLSHCGNYSRHFLTSVTGIIARDKMAAVLRCFTETANTFNLLGFNSTFFQLKPVVQAVVTYLGKMYQSKMAAAFKYQLPLADDHSSELEEFRGKIEAPIIVEEVPNELLGKVVDSEQKRFLADLSYCHRPILPKQLTEKKLVEKGSLAAVSERLSLALLPPEAIQLVATGHIADVRAKKAFMKAGAKELVAGLKTAASKVVEDLIAAVVEMVHMTTPLDTQISQTRKVALINGKSEIAAEDVLNELLEKVVKESEKRRSLALISVSD